MSTEELAGVGKGFLTETGQLKSKEQLAQEVTTAQESSTADNTEAAVYTSSDLGSAFGALTSGVYEQANKIAYMANEKEALVDEAAKLNKQLLKTAKGLKKMMKEGASQEEIDAATEKFNELKQQSAELAEKIDEHNLSTVADRSQSIRLGNKTIASFKVEDVQYTAVSGEVDSLKNVKQTIEELKATKQDLKSQKADLEQLREDVATATTTATQEIDDYAANAVKGYNGAKEIAQGIADQILAGSQDFLAAHALDVTSTILDSL